MQDLLLKSILTDHAPHAALITGPAYSGRRTLARRAAALHCLGEDAPERLIGCPNYIEMNANGLSVETVRDMIGQIALQGFNGGKRAVVLIDAGNMSPQIQNTLLKTLEEPSDDTLLLLTGNEYGLLPTIRSRCFTVRLGATSVQAVEEALISEGVDAARARLCARLSDGVIGRARALACDERMAFRQEALSLVEKTLFDYAPFAEMTALVTIAADDAASIEDDEIEPRKGGKKKKRADAGLAAELLETWLSVLRDALLSDVGMDNFANLDAQTMIERIAARFTIAQIQGMIFVLTQAESRIQSGASVSNTLDAAAARLLA